MTEVIVTKADLDKVRPKLCWSGVHDQLVNVGIDAEKFIRQGLTLNELQPIITDYRVQEAIRFAKIRLRIE